MNKIFIFYVGLSNDSATSLLDVECHRVLNSVINWWLIIIFVFNYNSHFNIHSLLNVVLIELDKNYSEGVKLLDLISI